MEDIYKNIPAEKFQFVEKQDLVHEKVLETKPRSFLADAFSRFCKNKGSIVGAVIILILVLYAIFGTIFSQYSVSHRDTYFRYARPRSELFAKTNFWDGCEEKEHDKVIFEYYYYMGKETGHYAVKNEEYEKKDSMYVYRLDSYHSLGCVFMKLSEEEYLLLQQYQNETGKQVIYPALALSKDQMLKKYMGASVTGDTVANYYYKFDPITMEAKLDASGNIIPNYKTHTVGETTLDNYNSLRIAGDGDNGVVYEYARPRDAGYEVRVNYYEYYIFNHSYVLKDGIEKPSFLFGANEEGQDIFTCLAAGALFSFGFAIAVALVNLIVGAIYGAIEGYYGGKVDLFMERFSDILSAVPMMIVVTLLKLHMGTSGAVLVLFISFFLTGWIGMASTTRMQFYRYKNQEYVLAARTLGASDARIIVKHIFPNAVGTLVTSCALVIPSMIYSEVNLSYLGIISLTSGNLTSVGTLLSSGQSALLTAPYVALMPSLFLALLLLSFNLFGNGLRDAFNPSLRGSEE